jgi:hypothetical protein
MLIRRISVGPDFKNAMNYIVGQKVVGESIISQIKLTEGTIDIWIKNDKGESVMWKSFTSTMPISIEYNIDHYLEQ